MTKQDLINHIKQLPNEGILAFGTYTRAVESCHCPLKIISLDINGDELHGLGGGGWAMSQLLGIKPKTLGTIIEYYDHECSIRNTGYDFCSGSIATEEGKGIMIEAVNEMWDEAEND